MQLYSSQGFHQIKKWLSTKSQQPFTFQEEAWQHIIDGKSGLVNAPAGCGKTFSAFPGALI